jgi:RimJ/RimL family protein N-acetyltransferase
MSDGVSDWGPEVDTMPRPLPARVKISGRYVELEPLHRRHAADLWRAVQGADDSFAYVPFGPFASFAAFERFIAEFAAGQERVAWAIRPVSTGEASGWLTLMDIQPANAAIEIGSIWFGPKLQRTKAATEAIYLLLKLAADDLGYRRLVWKCNSRNAGSKRAAERLGFVYEGQHRMHLTVKGRQRDTDWYSIIAPDWPRCRAALVGWLDGENFAPDGTAKRGLAEIRAVISE